MTSDPTNRVIFQQHIVSFVDDTSFILTAEPNKIPQLVKNTEILLNHWNIMLHFTGGALALDDKTKWCLSYTHNNDKHLDVIPQDGHTIRLRSSHKLSGGHEFRYEAHTGALRIVCGARNDSGPYPAGRR